MGDPKGSPNFWVRSYNLIRYARLIGARRGHRETNRRGHEVIATVDVSKETPLRSTSCELHRVLLARCSSG
jgi:hypothetical protein